MIINGSIVVVQSHGRRHRRVGNGSIIHRNRSTVVRMSFMSTMMIREFLNPIRNSLEGFLGPFGSAPLYQVQQSTNTGIITIARRAGATVMGTAPAAMAR